ncbi:16S rRNA (guanine(966)-N(2))-methyltransferase RsmD [Peribacillus sp. FSL H8-0477]|uniref:16S rRNA (guanine(966)-N(2))-methyltransferase RsmD n=1 Tax=Peribacillus sp. FSL H8-0477 TaxID=2921388 RepID=UPI0030F9C4C5
MRVVSGTCKGRALKAVPGTGTRPTTDKVKETIFNIIGPYFHGGLVLDLYAGSGGLGIEALSRGMDKAIFVDRDFKAFQTVKENIETCGFTECSELYKIDSERALKALIKRELRFGLILLDPPYKQQKIAELIEKIHNEGLLDDEGIILCEHSRDVKLPDRIETFKRERYEEYGAIAISIYKWGNA